MLTFTRLATKNDIKHIMPIIQDGQRNLAAAQIPQWQDGYPNRTAIENDIAHNEAYVLVNSETIIGYGVIRQTPEPNYRTPLTGTWVDDTTPYVSLHRVVVSSQFSGQHLGQIFMSNLLTISYSLGFRAARIDTHEKNTRMQHLITATGFHHECMICIDGDSTDLRQAYSLSLTQ
ncbi:GNAT family N-acetyltransferase [Weissella minor]|uniref:GNAT family N-acetyltransferase n=1 Tax=Weissella minor TaxID=1620 RepID=UPI003AF29F87